MIESLENIHPKATWIRNEFFSFFCSTLITTCRACEIVYV